MSIIGYGSQLIDLLILIDWQLETFLSYIRNHITEHKENFNVDDEPNDFTYAYLKEMHNRGGEDEIFR